MPKKQCLLTGMALTSVTCGNTFSSKNKTMDADIHSV